MLLPDNIHPELSIYYNGAIVIDCLLNEGSQAVLDLFESTRKNNDMSFSVFVLCLDWLYLIDVAKINENGVVELCSLKV